MQNESMPASENIKPQSDKSSMMKTIVMVVLVLALLGVGYWGYSTNSTLKATQTTLAASQKENEGLKKDKAELTANLTQTTTDLESTKATLEKTTKDLATAKASLTKTTSEKSALQTNVNKAAKYVDVLVSLNDDTSSLIELSGFVGTTGDRKLLDLWQEFLRSSTQANFNAFYEYLLGAISDSLN